jgi:hypothetical protein
MPARLYTSSSSWLATASARLGLLGLALLATHCSISEEPGPIGSAGTAELAGTPAVTAGSGGGAPVASGGVAGNSMASAGTAPDAGQINGGSHGGGSAGQAGSGAGGGLGGGASGGTSVPCPEGVLFCDDFESYAEQAPPSGKWKTWTVGAGKLVVDSMQGSRAAHFHGKVSQSGGSKEQAFMLAEGAPFPVTGSTFYMRFMLYGTRFPFTGVSDANHIALAWVGSRKALNSPDRGATNEGYMLADYNGVSIEPMWSGYFRDTSRHFKDANEANKWHCWEFEIDNAGGPPPGQGGVALPHIWEDGVELKLSPAGSGATYAAVPFEAILFSLWSPQTDTSAADYWVDDVAVSKSRINCPAAK